MSSNFDLVKKCVCINVFTKFRDQAYKYKLALGSYVFPRQNTETICGRNLGKRSQEFVDTRPDPHVVLPQTVATNSSSMKTPLCTKPAP